ncbi:MAG TPA: alpha/beta fold hydrolase, partial [Rhabdochlamydiaceae bacterium]|nr:alpha/beta fold hydrolase [Rhabdochlamydiaceae bacterium]
MFGSLTEKFRHLLTNLVGQKKLTEDNISEAVRDVRLALLDADVNYTVVSNFVKKVKERALGEAVIKSVDPGDQFVKIVHDSSHLIGRFADAERIILIGHSFGGSAVALAASYGAPVAGIILLDPAIVHENVKKRLRKVNVPIFLVGADKKVFLARERSAFRKFTSDEFCEISIIGATHDDAQDPSMYAQNTFGGFDPYTHPEKRALFN